MTWSVNIWFDLWLIGIAGGLSTVAFFIGLLTGDKERKLFKFATYVGLPLVALSVLFLLTDLGDPLRFWHFVTVFKFTSPMSLGTWAIISWSVVSVLLVLIWQMENRRGRTFTIGTGLVWLSAGLSFMLMAYGAVTPAVSGRPLWNSTVLLPAILIFSDISMGLAILILVGSGLNFGNDRPQKLNTLSAWLLSPPRSRLPVEITRHLSRANSYALILGAAALGGQLIGVFFTNLPGAREQLFHLTMGWLSIAFWMGVVILSLGLPLYLYLNLRKKSVTDDSARRPMFFASVCVLLGGFILRAVLITAGQL